MRADFENPQFEMILSMIKVYLFTLWYDATCDQFPHFLGTGWFLFTNQNSLEYWTEYKYKVVAENFVSIRLFQEKLMFFDVRNFDASAAYLN